MKRQAVISVLLVLSVSCSTIRSLSEGEYRLVENKVSFNGSTGLAPSDVSPYIKQAAFKWSPGLNIYNWARPGSDRWIDRLWRKVGTEPVIFDETLLPGSIQNMEGRMKDLGYYGSTVTAGVDTSNHKARVTYTVTPGKRFVIDTIIYDVPEGEFYDEFVADYPNMSVKPGSFLAETDLETESTRGAKYFRNLGYYDFNGNNYFFEADTLGEVTKLYYTIRGYTRSETPEDDKPVRKYTFGDVSIQHSGAIKFSDEALRRINIIKPGDTYSENEVNDNYSRFSTLRVFNSVGVSLQPREDYTLDCTITLRDSRQQGVKFNLEASTNSSGLMGVAPKISYYHKNIFHGGQRFSLDLSGNFQFKPNSDVHSTEVSGAVGISFPKFLGLSYSAIKGPYIPRTEVSVSYGYQDRPEYKRSIASVNYGYQGQAGKLFFYQVYPIKVEYVDLISMSEDFKRTLDRDPSLYAAYSDHLNAGLGSSLYFTTNNDLVPKTPFHYARLNFDLSGNMFSLFNRFMPLSPDGRRTILGVPYSQLVRAELSLGKTFMWGRNDGQAIALRFLGGAGYAYGNSKSLPFEMSFYAGGASSMRGWQSRTLGPGFKALNPEFAIPSQYGDFKLEFDVEYRAKLFWKMEGALFAEAGNIWNYHETSDFLRSVAMDWGAGLRLNLDFILIRVDCGVKLYEPCREADQRWRRPADWFKKDGFTVHLGVGYPF
ncbi:MAG: BamA/TamA family outer membrane protein [Bacteroidales bacterium]|nr:BamA/TamA family outer membrane protein [Bacteroidales bacterium]